MKKEELHSIISEENGVQIVKYGVFIKPEDVSKQIKNKKEKFIEIYGSNGQYFKVFQKEERKIVIIESMEEFQKILQKFHIGGTETISTIRSELGEPSFYLTRTATTNDNIFRFSKEISKEESEEISNLYSEDINNSQNSMINMKIELRQLIELTKSDITLLEVSLKKLKDKQVSTAIHGLESFIESKKTLLKELEKHE